MNRKNAGSGKPPLAARIAIDWGPVLVEGNELFGDTPNIAARAQAVAEPGEVVVTARVQRQIAGLFVAEERGSHEFRGVSAPVTLFRLVRASGVRRRAGQRRLTPLIGRDDEMAMLMRRWERARQGDGQLVLIVGEPGLGKSRLMYEFQSRLRDTPHTWVEWTCSQLLQNTSLHPITEWGRERFGGADVPAERRIAELESTLIQLKLDPAEKVPLLAPLMDIPLPTERMPTLAPDELRRRQLASADYYADRQCTVSADGVGAGRLALGRSDYARPVAKHCSKRRAVALVCPCQQSAGVPAALGRRARTTARFRSRRSTAIRCGIWSATLAALHALPNEVIDGVTERTGGVPLFIEEVTRLLLDRGEQGDIHAIPPTLQQSLTARLDRLGAAREVAQIGAVIGRDFSYWLLRTVTGMEEAPLQIAL